LTKLQGEGLYTYPRISPDNRYVLMLTLRPSPGTAVIDLTIPFEQRQLRRLSPPETPIDVAPLGWLADGRIVGTSGPQSKSPVVVVFKLDDKSSKTIPIPGLVAQSLVAGRYVLCAEPTGRSQLVDLTTGAIRPVDVKDANPNDNLVAVSGDGSSAYFVRLDVATNLWLIGK
jgi:hypothetical protein